VKLLKEHMLSITFISAAIILYVLDAMIYWPYFLSFLENDSIFRAIVIALISIGLIIFIFEKRKFFNWFSGGHTRSNLKSALHQFFQKMKKILGPSKRKITAFVSFYSALTSVGMLFLFVKPERLTDLIVILFSLLLPEFSIFQLIRIYDHHYFANWIAPGFFLLKIFFAYLSMSYLVYRKTRNEEPTL